MDSDRSVTREYAATSIFCKAMIRTREGTKLTMRLTTENVATDLESFSRHAGRKTITTDDVLLLARKNEDLHELLKDFVDAQKARKVRPEPKR
jgi:hypothetical protein